MNSRERIKLILAGKKADRCGLWLGNPHPDSWAALHDYFGRQLDILVSPKLFAEYIFRVMNDLIGLGVDAFHPLQAKVATEARNI